MMIGTYSLMFMDTVYNTKVCPLAVCSTLEFSIFLEMKFTTCSEI